MPNKMCWNIRGQSSQISPVCWVNIIINLSKFKVTTEFNSIKCSVWSHGSCILMHLCFLIAAFFFFTDLSLFIHVHPDLDPVFLSSLKIFFLDEICLWFNLSWHKLLSWYLKFNLQEALVKLVKWIEANLLVPLFITRPLCSLQNPAVVHGVAV